MAKYYVRWGFGDERGNLPEGYCYEDWFDTEELANQFIDDKRKRNGSYFQYRPPRYTAVTNPRYIALYLGNSPNPIFLTIGIPINRDAEEYIDEFLDGMLNDFLRYNSEWEFR